MIPELLAKELRKMTLATGANQKIFTSSEGSYLRHSNFMKRVFIPSIKKVGINDFTFIPIIDQVNLIKNHKKYIF